jgi:molybdopterin/thiamine biosynthesis adenylyltransferase/rhodanese-related sulfurtransferase
MPLSYRDLVAQARAAVDEVSAAELADRRAADLTIIDVREPDEHAQGAIPGSRHIARGVLESVAGNVIPSHDAPVALYCAVGARSALAAQALAEMGYTNVVSLEGGFTAWKNAGLEWEVPTAFSSEQRARYSRHLILPEIGEEGQQRLLGARALLIGAGGLGSPAALYLAAAGVGTLGIVDDDVVDASNLQRQVLHDLHRVGEKKVESARQTITALNSDVKVETHDTRLVASNAMDIMSRYDVVVDGADNFPTRYLVNDASLHLGIPVVHGSIFRFEGQVSVFRPYEGPCYRCLFSQPPPPELAPNCAEAGVLGVLPGIIGSIQAVEAIKVVLDLGRPLVGRLLTYDALDQDFTTLRIRRDPACLACGDEATKPVLVDYDESCVAVSG